MLPPRFGSKSTTAMDRSLFATESQAALMEAHETRTRDPIDQEALPADEYEAELRFRRLHQLQDDYGSTWCGINDPADPYNWPSHRKIFIGLLLSLAQLVTLMTASIITAALVDMARDLHVTMSWAQMVFSVYFLGLAFGPFLVAPVSEMYGRKWVWIGGNLWFVVWNALSPVGRSKDWMVVCRLMAGLGACAGTTLTGPVMADMYGKKDRGKAASISALLPALGPALGPIVGGLVTQLIEWPWIFPIMSIISFVITLIGLLCFRETYTPALLRRQTRARDQSERSALGPAAAFSEFARRLGVEAWRPIRLLCTRPVIQLTALVLGLYFAIYTIIIGTYATIFIERYGQDQSTSALHYIAIAVANTLGAQVGGRLMDRWYKSISNRRNNGQGKPEFRAPYLQVGIASLPLGLVLYGWGAEKVLPWQVLDIGVAIFCLGGIIVAQTLNAYLMDEFVAHAASASAATKVLSYTLGFAFPVFAPGLYDKLGYGWGNTLLGLVWALLCVPIPLIIWFWGDRLRSLGRGAGEGRIEGL